jgi:hypothetical protein
MGQRAMSGDESDSQKKRHENQDSAGHGGLQESILHSRLRRFLDSASINMFTRSITSSSRLRLRASAREFRTRPHLRYEPSGGNSTAQIGLLRAAVGEGRYFQPCRELRRRVLTALAGQPRNGSLEGRRQPRYSEDSVPAAEPSRPWRSVMPQKKRPDTNSLDEGITAKEQWIVSVLAVSNIAEDLANRQSKKLAKIIRRHQSAFRMFGELQQGHRALRLDEKRGPAQRRTFFRKVEAAIEAVENALEYATDESKTEILRRTLQTTAVPRLDAARRALAEIADWREFVTPTGGLTLQDPRRDATNELLDFFTNECGFEKSEAETRTAEIFTRFKWRDAPAVRGPAAATIMLEREALRKRRARARRPR